MLFKSAIPTNHRHCSAFTLIEVLVVVAIIALLVGILIPSLTMARIRAKITADQANMKQIATAMAIYQATDKGYVPIMLNWHSGPAYNTPARTVFLSVALRQGEKSLSGLAHRQSTSGQKFDPQAVWTVQTRDDYETRFLPAHYICPFERGNQPWELYQSGAGPSSLLQYEWKGKMESYQTWLWEDIVRGKKVHSEPFGWGNPLNGIPKYSVLTWNQVTKTGKSPGDKTIQNQLHRKWDEADARRLKSGALSSLTVAYCAIGEHMEMGKRRVDVGSHRTTSGGGTNAIFADTHVEWVPGTRIGWP